MSSSFALLLNFLFKTNNFIHIKWSSSFILNILKKYFYSEKIENSNKKTGIFSNFLTKLGINDQNSKKLNIRQNKAFLNEMQILLKKSILFLLKFFENKNFNQINDELLLETLCFIEDNEIIVFDSPNDYLEFFQCFVYGMHKFSEK